MPIEKGDNFDYQGQKFLDNRQNQANTINDLLSWSTPVPDGFEVCISGVWYTYNSANSQDPATGKFRPRDAKKLLAEILSKSEYDALSVIDSKTMYMIHDPAEDAITAMYLGAIPLSIADSSGDNTRRSFSSAFSSAFGY